MKSTISFDEFKLNSDGMIPVITQDYKTNEVLMLAYMTKESFEKTLETGKMTYFSRSRQELWTKGDTSGHYQYVKSLDIDCDKDTILAKSRADRSSLSYRKPHLFLYETCREIKTYFIDIYRKKIAIIWNNYCK